MINTLTKKEIKHRMSTKQQFSLYEQLEDLENIPQIRNVPRTLMHQPQIAKTSEKNSPTDLTALAEQENDLNFSYHASKHEKSWLINSLEDFYHQQWFEDILRLIKGGGKEASVYQCLTNGVNQNKYLAAKVYRPRQFRQLRNDSLYREGRMQLDDEGHEIRDDRALHAIQKRTNFGMRVMHTSWIEHEFQTMRILHQAGADVPKPYASGNNAILMDYIGWDDLPAPTLNTVDLSVRDAHEVFKRVIHNVEIMLENQRVHGDLSAYNILYRDGDVTLIDFPQAIDPSVNRNAYPVFRRDIQRLCEYFLGLGLRLDPRRLSDDLWRKHGFNTRQPIHPSLLEPEHIEDYH